MRKLNCLQMLASCFRTLGQVVPVGAAVLIGLLTTGSAHAQTLTGTNVVLTNATPQIEFIDNVGPDTRSFRFLGFDADFRFEDTTAGTIPFLIAGGAPTGSIRVDATGQVGFGAFTPQAHLHASTPDQFPRLRLESTNASSPHVWDLSASAFGFDLVDVTNNTTPFAVLPGAPTNSLFVGTTGRIGMGTATPAARLVVNETAASVFPMHINGRSTGTAITNITGPIISNTYATNNNWAGVLFSDASGGPSSGLMGVRFTNRTSHYGDFAFATRSAGGYTEKMRIVSTGNVGIGTTNPIARL